MARTIMPISYSINPGSVVCQICNSVAARNLDELPHCSQCGGSYCRDCLGNQEPSLRCAGDPDHCPLKLSASNPPTAA